MCLIVENNDLTPYKAEKPITVKKLLVRVGKWPFYTYYTPFRKKEVKFVMGRCKMGDGSMVAVTHNSMNYAIIDGKPQVKLETLCYNASAGGNPIVFEGIHAYQETTPSAAFTSYFLWNVCYCVVEGTIPKGAYYYIGNSGDIVADKMIIHKKFFDKKMPEPSPYMDNFTISTFVTTEMYPQKKAAAIMKKITDIFHKKQDKE